MRRSARNEPWKQRASTQFRCHCLVQHHRWSDYVVLIHYWVLGHRKKAVSLVTVGLHGS